MGDYLRLKSDKLYGRFLSLGDIVLIWTGREARAMDYTRFGLRRRPFRPTPDTEFYYPATSHEGALDQLRRGIADDEGLLLLTGDPGLGKTLLARRLLETLEEPIQSVLLTNGHLATNSDLLQAVLFDLDLPYQGLLEQASRLAITASLLERFQTGGPKLPEREDAVGVSDADYAVTRTLAEYAVTA